jgi:hypothetical protein
VVMSCQGSQIIVLSQKLSQIGKTKKPFAIYVRHNHDKEIKSTCSKCILSLLSSEDV